MRTTVGLFLFLVFVVSWGFDSTDIPTCGYAPGWNCRPHPLIEPVDYCRAVSDSSQAQSSVPVQPMEVIFALMHYFYPGNNSYRIPTGENDIKPLRDSWGFQYYSLEIGAFRWDQIFALDFNYDSSSYSKPGAQLFETARATDNLLIDINLPNGPDTGVLEKDHRWPSAACAFIPAPLWKLMRGSDLQNKSITTYCGDTVFPEGYLQVGTHFDVYMVTDRWFPIPEVPVFWYINRDTGEVAAQLYYQSLSLVGSQNYFWDFSKKIVPDEIARKMFRENPHYYFDINLDMVKRGCTDEIYQAVLKDQFANASLIN
eukprot:TRINITY_DN880_c0_g1_i1.p1 TRINITY_DN880_c0_g1~~TRINITY_DN880_c0_g1_i1.p1  ORF type:complete len:314 (+),score=36.18 TRINITY_DN880_c0_g1_i1:196-1137(+)